jgi:hypothetical protein
MLLFSLKSLVLSKAIDIWLQDSYDGEKVVPSLCQFNDIGRLSLVSPGFHQGRQFHSKREINIKKIMEKNSNFKCYRKTAKSSYLLLFLLGVNIIHFLFV